MYVPQKGSSNRLEKAQKELMRFVSEKLVSGDFYSGLPYKPMVTITKIVMVPNMRQAYVYFRNFDQNAIEQVLKFLTRISGELSQQWARVSKSKYTPSLEFRIEEENEETRRLEDIFTKIRKN